MGLSRTCFSLSAFDFRMSMQLQTRQAEACPTRNRSGFLRRGLHAVAVDRCRYRLQRGAPAALAQFIGVNKIIGSLVALRAFQRHRARNAANAEAASARLAFHPFAEVQSHVSVGRPFVSLARILIHPEKRPGAQQYSQSNDGGNHQGHEDHTILEFRTGFFCVQQFENTPSHKRSHRVVAPWIPIGYSHFGTVDFAGAEVPGLIGETTLALHVPRSHTASARAVRSLPRSISAKNAVSRPTAGRNEHTR
jgi:hypothetical protein